MLFQIGAFSEHVFQNGRRRSDMEDDGKGRGGRRRRLQMDCHPAFTPGASITEVNRGKILQAAKEMNNTPNLLARSLATNLTRQVAVFVDDFTNPHKLPVLEKLTVRRQIGGRRMLIEYPPALQPCPCPARCRPMTSRCDNPGLDEMWLLSSVSWLPPRLNLLFQSKFNAASNSKCLQVQETCIESRRPRSRL